MNSANYNNSEDFWTTARSFCLVQAVSDMGRFRSTNFAATPLRMEFPATSLDKPILMKADSDFLNLIHTAER